MSGNRSIRITGGILLTVAVVALVGPWVSPHDYATTNFETPGGAIAS